MKTDGTFRRHIAIIMPGQRLVAAGQADQRVVAVAAHRELDGIGDDLARHQRGLHALMAHGDAVGDGDRGEFARRAAGGGDALLGRLRLARQRDVAGRGLVPAGRDADEGLVDLLAASGPSHNSTSDAAPGSAFRHVPAGQRSSCRTFSRPSTPALAAPPRSRSGLHVGRRIRPPEQTADPTSAPKHLALILTNIKSDRGAKGARAPREADSQQLWQNSDRDFAAMQRELTASS